MLNIIKIEKNSIEVIITSEKKIVLKNIYRLIQSDIEERVLLAKPEKDKDIVLIIFPGKNINFPEDIKIKTDKALELIKDWSIYFKDINKFGNTVVFEAVIKELNNNVFN